MNQEGFSVECGGAGFADDDELDTQFSSSSTSRLQDDGDGDADYESAVEYDYNDEIFEEDDGREEQELYEQANYEAMLEAARSRNFSADAKDANYIAPDLFSGGDREMEPVYVPPLEGQGEEEQQRVGGKRRGGAGADRKFRCFYCMEPTDGAAFYVPHPDCCDCASSVGRTVNGCVHVEAPHSDLEYRFCSPECGRGWAEYDVGLPLAPRIVELIRRRVGRNVETPPPQSELLEWQMGGLQVREDFLQEAGSSRRIAVRKDLKQGE